MLAQRYTLAGRFLKVGWALVTHSIYTADWRSQNQNCPSFEIDSIVNTTIQ